MDRVQVMKQESTLHGGDDADIAEFGPTPIEPQEDAIEAAGLYLQEAAARDEQVLIDRVDGKMRFRDAAVPPITLSQVLANAIGLTEAAHEELDYLGHEIAETSFYEVSRNTSGQVVSEIWWTDSGKTTKIREFLYTRNSRGQVTQEVRKQYGEGGALLRTLTIDIERDQQGRVESMQYTRS